jgi:hypothetical protein
MYVHKVNTTNGFVLENCDNYDIRGKNAVIVLKYPGPVRTSTRINHLKVYSTIHLEQRPAAGPK